MKSHALDQLAQFLAQVFAGIALQGPLEVFGQALVALGDARMQLHGLGRGFGQ